MGLSATLNRPRYIAVSWLDLPMTVPLSHSSSVAALPSAASSVVLSFSVVSSVGVSAVFVTPLLRVSWVEIAAVSSVVLVSFVVTVFLGDIVIE